MSTRPEPQRVDLRQLFLRLQEGLAQRLSVNRELISHPGTKGDATELNWHEMLKHYLPQRYRVSKGFVLDARGFLSDQIDLIIHDTYFSPFLFNQDGTLYIPAESVYAVLEIKQELSREMVLYAAEKAATVRRLQRTSVSFPHVGGTSYPRPPAAIVAGLLCLESSWTPHFGDPLLSALADAPEAGRLDLICAARHGSVDVTYNADGTPSMMPSPDDAGLIFFFIHLLERLRAMGNVPALDLQEYGRSLND